MGRCSSRATACPAGSLRLSTDFPTGPPLVGAVSCVPEHRVSTSPVDQRPCADSTRGSLVQVARRVSARGCVQATQRPPLAGVEFSYRRGRGVTGRASRGTERRKFSSRHRQVSETRRREQGSFESRQLLSDTPRPGPSLAGQNTARRPGPPRLHMVSFFPGFTRLLSLSPLHHHTTHRHHRGVARPRFIGAQVSTPLS